MTKRTSELPGLGRFRVEATAVPRRDIGPIALIKNLFPTESLTADSMMDTIRTSLARVTCWLVLPGASLLLTSGCAQLKGPGTASQNAGTSMPMATGSPVPITTGTAGESPKVIPAVGGISPPGVVSPAGGFSADSSSGGVQQVGTESTTDAPRYTARQFPTTPPPPLAPADAGVGAAPLAAPNTVTTMPPGNAELVPSPYPNVGGIDPYAPVTPYAPYQGPRVREADLIINGFPARTGRIMLGGAVNSDAGLTGQLTVDERNFDICRFPRSFRDLFSGNAFRGAGQTFRVEAAPGTDFKRYTIQFADPNLFGYKPVSMSVSGFLYDRRFDDWDEERTGGRLAFGYRVTPDLSVSAGISGQNAKITRPRVVGVPQLDAVLGNNELYSGEVSLTHDTRNSPIQASQGHYFEFKFEEIFGDYDYARFELEYRKYWLVAERADESGKQTISYSTQLGFSGDDTPIFENFFAGGYATIRGFEFRGASPVQGGVDVGGRFQWLNTVEYMFPITADDAFRGVAFVDFGTVEPDVKIDADSFRVAPGLGLRVAIPMLGPAPLAFDFAYPVAKADTDQTRLFSFYMSLIR